MGENNTMIDSKGLIKIVLLGTIAISGYFIPLLNTIAQQSPYKTQKPSPSPQVTTQKAAWDTLWEMVKSRINQKQPLGSRGGTFCVVSPGQLGEKQLIWHERPMFFWGNTTNPTRLEFRIYSPFNPQQDQTVLWRKRLTTESPRSEFQTVQYIGETLNNSQTYKWEYLDLVDHRKFNGNFQLISVEDHQRIAEDLKVLERQLQKQGIPAEEIILKKSIYFANKDLWSDVLQELSLVTNPSPTLVSQRQLLFDYVCGS